MKADIIYSEKISSKRTTLLFITLTLLFLALSVWRIYFIDSDFLAGVFVFLYFLFIFYSLNYRTLTIHITHDALKLSFGIFSWNVPLANIEECAIDNIPLFMKMGGAGIHFMLIKGRYRASFNFLEYPRVVISLKQKAGPVKDISFTTCHPNDVIQHIFDLTSNILPSQ